MGIVAGAVAGDGLLGSRKRGIGLKRSSSTTSDELIILKPLVGKRMGRDRALRIDLLARFKTETMGLVSKSRMYCKKVL